MTYNEAYKCFVGWIQTIVNLYKSNTTDKQLIETLEGILAVNQSVLKDDTGVLHNVTKDDLKLYEEAVNTYFRPVGKKFYDGERMI
jgi:hypothetical protein